jgi:putative transposase
MRKERKHHTAEEKVAVLRRHLLNGYVEHYNSIRLNSAIGYVAPKDMLAGHQRGIHTERDRKLAAARRHRQLHPQQAASLQANLCS